VLKICSYCKVKKDISEFRFRKERNYYLPQCKQCESNKNNSYNKEHAEQTSTNRSNYYKNNKEKELNNNKKWTENNRDIRRVIDNNFYYSSKSNPHYIINRKIRSLIRYSLYRNKLTKINKTFDMLPYTVEILKEHIENKFEYWMIWDNSGIYDPKTWDDNDTATWKWQLDHIIPQSDLPYTSVSDDNFKKCWDLSNLRPLSAKQNILDGTRKSRHTDKRGKGKNKSK